MIADVLISTDMTGHEKCHDVLFKEMEVKMSPNELITAQELAKRLNVQVSWIYRRTRLGQEAIPHIKMGKYVRFDWVEVLEFLKDF